MNKTYSNLDIHFMVSGVQFKALNIAFERFEHSVPRHSHGARSYEIHYVPIGFGTVEVDGTEYSITPGTVYMTGPYVDHLQMPRMDDPMGEYCIFLTCEYEKDLEFPLSGDPSFRETYPGSVADLFLNTPFWFGKDTQNLNSLMHILFFELEHRLPGYREQIDSILTQLIVHMVRNYRHPAGTSSSITSSSLNDIKALLIDNYFLYEYKSLSLPDLAKRLGSSPRQTERFLTDYYGKTFQQKKTESRMSAARILLSDVTRSITSISEDLGYSSIEHFSNAFKRYYGCSPRAYRKDHPQAS